MKVDVAMASDGTAAAEARWDEVRDATRYAYSYRVGSGSWREGVTKDSGVRITGVTCSDTVELEVEALGDDGKTSIASGSDAKRKGNCKSSLATAFYCPVCGELDKETLNMIGISAVAEAASLGLTGQSVLQYVVDSVFGTDFASVPNIDIAVSYVKAKLSGWMYSFFNECDNPEIRDSICSWAKSDPDGTNYTQDSNDSFVRKSEATDDASVSHDASGSGGVTRNEKCECGCEDSGGCQDKGGCETETLCKCTQACTCKGYSGTALALKYACLYQKTAAENIELKTRIPHKDGRNGDNEDADASGEVQNDGTSD